MNHMAHRQGQGAGNRTYYLNNDLDIPINLEEELEQELMGSLTNKIKIKALDWVIYS